MDLEPKRNKYPHDQVKFGKRSIRQERRAPHINKRNWPHSLIPRRSPKWLKQWTTYHM